MKLCSLCMFKNTFLFDAVHMIILVPRIIWNPIWKKIENYELFDINRYSW